MRLIIGQLPITAGWRDAHVAAWNLAEAIWQNIIYKKQLFLMVYHQNVTHL